MPTELRLMVYDADRLEEATDLPLEEAIRRMKAPGVGWLSVYDTNEADHALLERELGLHPLALEDTRNERQRPKVEEYPESTYLVARSLRDVDGEIVSEQSNIFFSANWVLVVHERPLGLFNDVRERIRHGRPRIRSSGPDYLVYALLDAIVDTYFPVLTALGDEIEDLEDEMFAGEARKEQLDRMHRLKTGLRRVRRTVWPARDAFTHLLREESRDFLPTTRPFLRDVVDHTNQAIDLTENHRETTTSLMDLYLNIVSQRMNEIMKVLTIVATLFIPLTFLAGVYGMNFDPDLPGNMPELNTPYAYVAFWAMTLVLLIGGVLFFRRKGWL